MESVRCFRFVLQPPISSDFLSKDHSPCVVPLLLIKYLLVSCYRKFLVIIMIRSLNLGFLLISITFVGQSVIDAFTSYPTFISHAHNIRNDKIYNIRLSTYIYVIPPTYSPYLSVDDEPNPLPSGYDVCNLASFNIISSYNLSIISL